MKKSNFVNFTNSVLFLKMHRAIPTGNKLINTVMTDQTYKKHKSNLKKVKSALDNS